MGANVTKKEMYKELAQFDKADEIEKKQQEEEDEKVKELQKVSIFKRIVSFSRPLALLPISIIGLICYCGV
jgi:hypothetical protein